MKQTSVGWHRKEASHNRDESRLGTRSPFFFALVFFVVSFCLTFVDFFVLLYGTDQVVQSLLANGVLVWLGWLRLAGFNDPSQLLNSSQ